LVVTNAYFIVVVSASAKVDKVTKHAHTCVLNLHGDATSPAVTPLCYSTACACAIAATAIPICHGT
jgi:hypothetical protein